jgi:hypothetical protein
MFDNDKLADDTLRSHVRFLPARGIGMQMTQAKEPPERGNHRQDKIRSLTEAL